MASTARLALSVCEKGNASCVGVLGDIAALLLKQKKIAKTFEVGEEFAKQKCRLITDSLQDARSASMEADRACTEANKQAVLLNKDAAVKEMFAADAASKKAGGIATKVQGLYAEARQVKHDIMKEIMFMDFKVRDQKLKKLVEEEQKQYLRVTEEIEAEIQRLEQELKKKLNKQMQEKVRQEAEALKERLILQQRKHFEVTRARDAWTKDVTDANAFAKMMDQYQYALTTAPDLDQWLEEYRKLLQDAIPKFLYDWYNTTGAGCLDPEFEEDFIVAVELAEVPGRNETLSEKCESPNF
jgi:hypothetical protein